MLTDTQEMVVVPDMHTRKRLMFERSDAFVALPGGVGTLEELVEQMTWVQLQQHTKPVLIADIDGFWRPLLALLDHMRANGFVRPDAEVSTLVADDAAAIVPMLQAAVRRTAWRGRNGRRWTSPCSDRAQPARLARHRGERRLRARRPTRHLPCSRSGAPGSP